MAIAQVVAGGVDQAVDWIGLARVPDLVQVEEGLIDEGYVVAVHDVLGLQFPVAPVGALLDAGPHLDLSQERQITEVVYLPQHGRPQLFVQAHARVAQAAEQEAAVAAGERHRR